MDITKADRDAMLETARDLREGEEFEFHNVTIWKEHGRWWTQEKDGGVQFSNSAAAAVRKAVALLRAAEDYRRYRRSR